ncbi:MAG: hypothetical protein ACREBJ_07780, partial [Nitrosotalea sp.]
DLITVAQLFEMQKTTENEIDILEKRIEIIKKEKSEEIKKLRKEQLHKKHRLSEYKEQINLTARIFFESNEKCEISKSALDDYRIKSREELLQK